MPTIDGPWCTELDEHGIQCGRKTTLSRGGRMICASLPAQVRNAMIKTSNAPKVRDLIPVKSNYRNPDFIHAPRYVADPDRSTYV